MGITKYEKTEKISDSKFAAFGHGKLAKGPHAIL